MININSDIYYDDVRLGSMNVGDTFLMDGLVCMIAKRNGYNFVLDLSTGEEYCSINSDNCAKLVVPIECNLSYRIKEKRG